MKAYGNVRGRIHRTTQPPPEATCNRCGKSLGRTWEGGLCEKCQSNYAPPPAGFTRCHRCRKPKPNAEFMDAKGRRRVCCTDCRTAVAESTAKSRQRRKTNLEKGR